MRRKRPRSAKLLFLLSAVLALGATLVLRGHLLRLEARAAAAGPGQATVVAAVDLARGSTLEPGVLAIRSIPSAYRPPGALGRIEDAVGRTIATDVVTGEAVTTARLAGSGGPIAAAVPPGLRASPVAVAAPPGLLAPGDRVDVLATFAAGQPHTETVASGAEVLQILRGPSSFDELTTIVVLVSPETAERLAYARSFAELSIAIGSSTPSDTGSAS